MNILIVASKFPPEYSGPGVRIPKLYESIQNAIGAKNITVLCGGIEYTKNEVYNYNGLTVRRIVPSYIRLKGFPFKFLPKSIYEIVSFFAENISGLQALKDYKNVDMVHIIGTSGLTASALHWARKKDIPTFLELVTAKASPLQRFMLFGRAKPPQKSIIVSMREDVRERCNNAGYSNQVWHRPNPFDETVFYPVSREEKITLRSAISPFLADDIVLASVAKIIPQKNQIFLLEVVKELDSRFKLIIAGPKVTRGPLYKRDKHYLNSIYNKIKECNLQDRVHLVTDYVQSHAYMKASDLYMLPAYDEGFGTPMMEAIACGTPVIANKEEKSFAEWIDDRQNGFLEPLQAKLWAQACIEASNMPLGKKLSEAQKITELAGQKSIYAEYILKIKSLTQGSV